MKKIFITGLVATLLLWDGIYSAQNKTAKSNPQVKNSKPSVKVVNVDEIIKHPEFYQDTVGVKGVVLKGDRSKKLFLLGCEDACYFMPVQYKGSLPTQKSKVIVFGSISKSDDGKFVFVAKEIK